MSILDPENLLQEKVFLTIDVKGGNGVNWIVVPDSSRSVAERSYRALVKFKSIDIFVLIEEGEHYISEMKNKGPVKFLPTAIEITLTVNEDKEKESKFIEFVRERFAPYILERNQELSDLNNYEVTQHRFVEFLYSKGLNKTKDELLTYLINNGFRITQEREYKLAE